MNRLTTRITIALIFGLNLPASGANATTLEEKVEETLAFPAGSLLDVSNINGLIEVSAWDRNEVHIEAEKKVRTRDGADAAEALEALKVIIEQTAEGVRVDTEHPRSDGRWRRGTSTSVNYRIQVPTNADLDLETVNGKVDVEGVRGDLNLSSTNGSVTVEDASGRVDAHTTNGGIDVELHEVVAGEDMSFRSTNGGITVALPADAAFDLEARTTNGGINIDFPVTVQGEISKRGLRGEINGGGSLITLKTTNGGIRIEEI